MATLKLPDNPTPEQFEKLKKPLVKRIIEEFYTDGINDLTVELGKDGAIASGKFLDVVMMGGKQNNRVFEYKLTKSGSEYKLDYKPISGDFGEDGGSDGDSANYSEPTTEFELITDADIANYQEQCNQALVQELQAVGLGSFVEPDEPDSSNEPEWARV